MASTITPIKSPDTVLAEAADEDLLRSIILITHAIHGVRSTNPARADELREQRAMIRDEALRRMGGTR